MNIQHDYAIILTCCAAIASHKTYIYQKNKKNRIATYVKSITQWIEKTNLPIVVIDNSAYNFPMLKPIQTQHPTRFEIISFDEKQRKEYTKYYNAPCKGWSEGVSIDYAYKNSHILKNANFIIKITGRYYIPDLESYLKQFDSNQYSVFGQLQPRRCEMVGCHKNYFKDIFSLEFINSKGRYDYHVENVYAHRLKKHNKKIPPRLFNITPTQQGGQKILISVL